jgi:hypothetical protein
MRVAKPIVLEGEIRRKLELEQQARGRSTPVRVALRSRIVLLAADGLQNEQIAAQMERAPRTVARWCDCFLKLGIPDLLKDAARPGRTLSIPATMVTQVIEKTTQSSQRHALVAQHDGPRGGRIRLHGRPHLAGQRPQAAPR